MEKVIAREITHVRREEAAKVMAPASYVPAKKKSAPRKLWDNYKEVAVIQKTDRLRIVVAACCREGYRCINLREFYHRKRDNVWVPGRDGIMIPIAAPVNRSKTPDPNNPPKLIYPMQEMMLALQQTMEEAMTMELDDPDNAVWLLPKVKAENVQEETEE